MGTSVDPYIMYGFWAFISLLLITILAVLFRNTKDIGELKGEVRGLHARLDDTNRRIEEMHTSLSSRIGEVNSNLSSRIEEVNSNLSSRIEEVNSNLSSRIENLERVVAALTVQFTQLNREVGEIKGTLSSLTERVGLAMRHRHDDDTGEVILTPEQVAAD